MAYAEPQTGIAPNNMPVNASLNAALASLSRCEEIASNIRARIHGAVPIADGAKSPSPDHANWMANDLRARLDTLANNLADIDASF